MTRNGKIARLPRTVREPLNQRLADGEPSKGLVAWLNGLPEVKEVLDRDFAGKGITEQNLSEWKQGGFVDWQRHQESLECMRTAAEQARELAAEAGAMPLTDVLSASVTLLLTRLIREVEKGGESNPETRAELLMLIREWTMLRKADHRAARLKMVQADWDTARAKVAEAEAREAEKEAKAKAYAESPEGKIEAFDKKYQAVETEVIRETMKIMHRRSLIDTLCTGMKPDKAKLLRDHIEDDIKQRQDKMLEEFQREFLLEAVEAAIAAGDFKKIAPDLEAVKQPEQEEAAADEEPRTVTDEAENRTESDPIRLNPTAQVASSESESDAMAA